MPDLRCQIPDARHQMPDARCQITSYIFTVNEIADQLIIDHRLLNHGSRERMINLSRALNL